MRHLVATGDGKRNPKSRAIRMSRKVRSSVVLRPAVAIGTMADSQGVRPLALVLERRRRPGKTSNRRQLSGPLIQPRKAENVKTIAIASLKVTIPFRAGELPKLAPMNPAFELVLGGIRIQGKVNAKAARKAASWGGSGCLQGRLVAQDGRLILTEGGILFNDPSRRPSPMGRRRQREQRLGERKACIHRGRQARGVRAASNRAGASPADGRGTTGRTRG